VYAVTVAKRNLLARSVSSVFLYPYNFPRSAYTSALKMEATVSSETLVPIYQTP
jgi:hypothetical protein